VDSFVYCIEHREEKITKRNYKQNLISTEDPGRVVNPRPVATIKTGRVVEPITDAF